MAKKTLEDIPKNEYPTKLHGEFVNVKPKKITRCGDCPMYHNVHDDTGYCGIYDCYCGIREHACDFVSRKNYLKFKDYMGEK